MKFDDKGACVGAMASVVLLLAAASCAQDARKPNDGDPPAGREAAQRPEAPPFDDHADRPRMPPPPERGPEHHPERGLNGGPRPPSPRGGPAHPPPEFHAPGFDPAGFDPGRPPLGGPRPMGDAGSRRDAGRQSPPRPFPSPSAALEKYDPEMYKLLQEDQKWERTTADLAMRWRFAPRAERDALKKELTEAVNQHFEARQQRRRLQLQRLEEELQSLRAAIEKRDQARTDVIERRVSELLGVEEQLGF